MQDHISIRNRGHLPHWERKDACYFVTFRCADSLPANVLKQMESERQTILRMAHQADRDLSSLEKNRITRFATLERYLDAGSGTCLLAKAQIAELVSKALQFFDGERYTLFAWCVMPNHVHVVLSLIPGVELSAVIHSWKSFSAKQINRAIGGQGGFWQREYYDHLVRNTRDFERVVHYVADNPVKTGLHNWPWVWIRED